MNSIFQCTVAALMMLAAVPQYSYAQNAEWFCPNCGKSGNKGNFCPDCGNRKPVDGVLFFDDMQSGDPSERWCVAELKDFENSGLGIDGTFKVEYSGHPEVLYATRQGCKVIDTTPVKCKSTWTRLHWDAFHEHSREETSVDEKIEYGTLRPAINGHPLFVPENYTIEFDMYLFTPASGPRKDDSEDWCFVNFCGQEFMINTWGKNFTICSLLAVVPRRSRSRNPDGVISHCVTKMVMPVCCWTERVLPTVRNSIAKRVTTTLDSMPEPTRSSSASGT